MAGRPPIGDGKTIVRCQVPHCIRYRARVRKHGEVLNEGAEFLCAPHWRMVAPSFKSTLRKLKKRAREPNSIYRAWRRCVVAAIKAAGGLI